MAPAAAGMRFLKRQFFLVYGILGCIAPITGVFLREQGFSHLQVGIALAISTIPALVSPVLLTLLADRKLETRHILTVAGTLAAVVISMMYLVPDVPVRMGLFFFYGLLVVGMIPLLDGLYFTWAERFRLNGEAMPTYPGVRLWGTVGYVLPTFLLLLVFHLVPGTHTDLVLPAAVIYCVICVASSLCLPALRRLAPEDIPAPVPASAKPRLPTWEAFQMLFSPQARWLTIALVPANMAAVMYAGFIPLVFEEIAGIPKKWIGTVVILGAVLEVGYTLGMPWMHRVFRLKGIIVLGLVSQLLRLVALSFFPVPWVAVVVQLVHGMEVMGLIVAPIILINRLAHEDFRNSIQGVYTMTILAVSRILGYVLAGFLAAAHLMKVLHWGAVLSGLSLAIFVWRYQRIRPEWEDEETRAPGSGTPPETGPVTPEESEKLLAG